MKGPGRRQAVAGRPPALRGRREESDGRLTKQRRTAVRRCSDSHGMRMGVDLKLRMWPGKDRRRRRLAAEFGLWICDGQRTTGIGAISGVSPGAEPIEICVFWLTSRAGVGERGAPHRSEQVGCTLVGPCAVGSLCLTELLIL